MKYSEDTVKEVISLLEYSMRHIKCKDAVDDMAVRVLFCKAANMIEDYGRYISGELVANNDRYREIVELMDEVKMQAPPDCMPAKNTSRQQAYKTLYEIQRVIEGRER